MKLLKLVIVALFVGLLCTSLVSAQVVISRGGLFGRRETIVVGGGQQLVGSAPVVATAPAFMPAFVGPQFAPAFDPVVGVSVGAFGTTFHHASGRAFFRPHR